MPDTVDIVATCQSVIVFSWFAAAYCTEPCAPYPVICFMEPKSPSQRQYNRSDFVWMSIWVWWVGSMLVRPSVRLSIYTLVCLHVFCVYTYIPSRNADRLTKKRRHRQDRHTGDHNSWLELVLVNCWLVLVIGDGVLPMYDVAVAGRLSVVLLTVCRRS